MIRQTVPTVIHTPSSRASQHLHTLDAPTPSPTRRRPHALTCMPTWILVGRTPFGDADDLGRGYPACRGRKTPSERMYSSTEVHTTILWVSV